MIRLFNKIFARRNSSTGKESKAVCPYCKRVLEKRPQRKKKCPYCNNYIYALTSPRTRVKVLVTAEEAKEIELEWQKVNFTNKWLRNLGQYGIGEKYFHTYKAKLSQKSAQEVSDRDVLWSIFNELITKTKDLHSLKMIYYEMALFLNEEGKDFVAVLQQSAKMELMKYEQDDSVKKVRILTSGEGSCEACRQLEGKVFTIKEALEKKPIPCEKCTYKLYSGNRGFCRCTYVAETE